MSFTEMRRLRRLRILAPRWAPLAIAVLMSTGCGGEAAPPLIPVVGKVTIDGKPATEGSVAFRAISNGAIQPAGLISEDGSYKVYLDELEGAPVGEYSVVVFVRKTPRTATGEMAGLPAVIVNRKFTDPNTTPLKVTVKEDAPPGSYDLAVTR